MYYIGDDTSARFPGLRVHRRSLIDLLSRSFQTVNQKQVEAFVVDLFNYCRDSNAQKFQQHMRDFLISLKVGWLCELRLIACIC